MTSKYLSYILRHDPAACGIELDKNGWANVNELIAGAQESGKVINRAILIKLVNDDCKGRFECAGQMAKDGYKFYQTANGVWLTERVPTKYIEVL